jgi:hypothetical protein
VVLCAIRLHSPHASHRTAARLYFAIFDSGHPLHSLLIAICVDHHFGGENLVKKLEAFQSQDLFYDCPKI